VRPKLAAKIKEEREGGLPGLHGDKVEDSLFWRPTTPLELEELCGSLDPNKGMGYDEVSMRVIKTVARKILGPLSHLFNYCIREGRYPAFFKVARIRPFFESEDQRSSPTTDQSRCSRLCPRCLRGCCR
jgi:hypothetical protein